MKFQLPAPDHEYESAMISGGVNGGTVWLDNIAQALRWHGHEAEMVNVNKELDADFVIVQSEVIKWHPCREFSQKGGKIICLLSHFTGGHYHYAPVPKIMEWSKYIVSTWEGEVLDCVNQKALLFPHAYGDLMDTGKINRRGSVVFAGNTYPLRKENWLEGIDVTRIYGTLPQDMPSIYRGADVCLNFHGDFQKNIISNESSRVSDKAGMMINERFWNILGSGGLLITDWVPQMERWFRKEELIVAENPKEMRELTEYYKIHVKEGLDKLSVARKRVQKEHTYKERVKDLLKWIS